MKSHHLRTLALVVGSLATLGLQGYSQTQTYPVQRVQVRPLATPRVVPLSPSFRRAPGPRLTTPPRGGTYIPQFQNQNRVTTRGIDPQGAMTVQGMPVGRYATQATQARQATQATPARQYRQYQIRPVTPPRPFGPRN